MEKVNDMYSKIDYNFIFPAKRGKKRSYQTNTWKYCFHIIVERKGVIMGEVAPPAEA